MKETPTQAVIDGLVNASRTADEGPSDFVRRVWAAALPQPAPAVPVLYVSPEQLEAVTEDDGDHGRYLPVRKSVQGKFTQALYAAAPQATAAVPDGRLHADGCFTWATHHQPWYGLDRGLPRDFYLASPPPAEQRADAARDVLAERRRQVEVEGWTAAHDDEHGDGSMALAAACYALADNRRPVPGGLSPSYLWKFTGWADNWFKPKDRRSNLIRAAALLLAEIERLDRADAARAAEPPASLRYRKGCDQVEFAQRLGNRTDAAAQPAGIPDECVASGQSCDYGPHGPKGERQCRYCGAQPSTQADARCQHCIDRHDGFYGSYAPPCPVHDDDGKLRATTPQPSTQPSDAPQQGVATDEQIDLFTKVIGAAAECHAKHWGLPLYGEWPAFYRKTFRDAFATQQPPPAEPGEDAARLDWLEANASTSWGGDYKVLSARWAAGVPIRVAIDAVRAAPGGKV